MPVYREGECFICGEWSDRLLPDVKYLDHKWIIGYCCPACREYFRWAREERVHDRDP